MPEVVPRRALARNPKDFYAGLMFTVIGLGFALAARGYNLGQASNMGPGYFPTLLGVLLALLGAGMCVRAVMVPVPEEAPIGPWAWRPLLHIIAANLLFGLCLQGWRDGQTVVLPPLGLVVGIFVLVFVASRADGQFRWRSAFLSAGVLSLLSYLLFPVLLKLPLPVWPDFSGF